MLLPIPIKIIGGFFHFNAFAIYNMVLRFVNVDNGIFFKVL